MAHGTNDTLLPHHSFTVEEYHRMGEAGLFEEQRVELLEGKIIDMSPIQAKHARIVKWLNRLLHARLSDRYIISVQDPIRLDELNEPEPDLAVLRFRTDFYGESHPRPEDVLLLIEVADTSLDKDRQVKLPLYARAGIPEVWIVNLPGQQLECYTGPTGDGYARRTDYRAGDRPDHPLLGKLEVARIFAESQ